MYSISQQGKKKGDKNGIDNFSASCFGIGLAHIFYNPVLQNEQRKH